MTSLRPRRRRPRRTRPVTFAFNGGPGSSSVWLHLGLLGPRRVDSGDVGALDAAARTACSTTPSRCSPSPTSSSSTRCRPATRAPSRAASRRTTTASEADIESVGELIRLWTTRNNRWLSPKFLAGESYGTPARGRPGRAPPDPLRPLPQRAHAHQLGARPRDGRLRVQRNDRAHVDYLPTYAAVAHYHGKHGRKSLQDRARRGRGVCRPRLPVGAVPGLPAHRGRARRARGDGWPALTGLTEDYVDRADLRIEHVRFFTELLRDERLAVGRLDARFTGPAGGTATPRTGTPTRRTTRSPARTPRPGTTTSATSSATRSDLPYDPDLVASLHRSGRTRSSRAEPVDVVAQARARHAGQPAPQGAHRLRLPRRRDAVLRRAEDVVAHLRHPGDRCATTSSTPTTRPAT